MDSCRSSLNEANLLYQNGPQFALRKVVVFFRILGLTEQKTKFLDVGKIRRWIGIRCLTLPANAPYLGHRSTTEFAAIRSGLCYSRFADGLVGRWFVLSLFVRQFGDGCFTFLTYRLYLFDQSLFQANQL